ncbi:MAG TPA: hypothetical protein PL023_05955 [Thiobacillus sp.]|nr:hypothetical protein [Thiobacillus sp.]
MNHTDPHTGTVIDEVAAGLYRISSPVTIPGSEFSFDQYLLVDDAPPSRACCRPSGSAMSAFRTSRPTNAGRSTTGSRRRRRPSRCAAAWPRWCR